MQRIFTGTSLEQHCTTIRSQYAKERNAQRTRDTIDYIIATLALATFITLALI